MGPSQHHRDRGAGSDDPFGRFERARDDLWSLLDGPWAPFASWLARLGEAHVALADLEETDDAFVLEVELPGIDQDDVTIELEGRRLIVTGERKERERSGILRRRTRVTGQLRHEVVLPADVDESAVEATMDKGVVSVRLPKADPTGRRRIRIT